MTRTKKHMNRRAFLSKGMAGIAGAVTLPHFIADGSPIKRAKEDKKYKIVYRTLGKTGIKLPIVSMGTMDATSDALLRPEWSCGRIRGKNY